MRSIHNAAVLAAGLCLGVLMVSSIPKEQPELNGVSLNGVALNGANLNGASLNGTSFNGISVNGVSTNRVTVNGTSVSGQFSPPISGETAQSTTATLNNMPVQAISLEGGQLIFYLDNAQ